MRPLIRQLINTDIIIEQVNPIANMSVGSRCNHIVVLATVPSLRGAGNRSESLHILGDSKFVKLLKTVRSFNHKTNDAGVSKMTSNFKQNCVQLMG